MKRKQTVCFHCGTPTNIQVSKLNGAALARYICDKDVCWSAWRKLAE